MNVGRRAAGIGIAALAVTRGARADAALESLLGRIARARAGVHTLRGPFTQMRTIGLLATDVHSTGSFALVRPDRLRWELDPPDAVTFWMGPDGLAYRDLHGEDARSRARPARARRRPFGPSASRWPPTSFGPPAPSSSSRSGIGRRSISAPSSSTRPSTQRSCVPRAEPREFLHTGSRGRSC
jgi:hypothetical protein